MPNETQISKWGNSLAVRIPQSIAKRAALTEGNRVSVDLAEDGSIVLRSSRQKHSLGDLVSRITARNRHHETDWSGPTGKELCRLSRFPRKCRRSFRTRVI